MHPLELDRIVAQRRDWHRGGDEQDRYPTLDDHRRGGLGERLFFGGFQPQSLAQCLGLSFPLGCKAYFSARLRQQNWMMEAAMPNGPKLDADFAQALNATIAGVALVS